MPGDLADIVRSYPDRLRAQALANARQAARQLELRLKAGLGRPYPPASRPGQYPHQRTERLQREVYAEAILEGTDVILFVSSPAPYSSYLVKRGRKLTQAIFDENREQVEEILLRRGYDRLPER